MRDVHWSPLNRGVLGRMVWANVLVEVSEHEARVQLVNVDLRDARVGEAMTDGGVREDQDARRGILSTERGKGTLDIFTGMDDCVAHLSKPGTT